MGASGCDRKGPEVWGQSQPSSDAHARKAAQTPDDPNIEDALEKQDPSRCPLLWRGREGNGIGWLRKRARLGPSFISYLMFKSHIQMEKWGVDACDE